MMEWYEAYATMQNQMDLTKDIILNAAKAIDCGEKIQWDKLEIDLGKFSQEKLSDLVLSHNNDLSKKD